MDPRALKRTQSLSSWSSEELSSEVDSCSTAFSESDQVGAARGFDPNQPQMPRCASVLMPT